MLEDFYGHYELSRGSIFNSLNVFDEVHLFLNEEKADKVIRYFFTTIKALLKTQTPVVLMSATLPRNMLKALRRVGDFKIVEYSSDKDKDFRNEKLSIDLKTKLIDNDQISEIVKEGNFDKVLIVVNTVKRAVEIYEKLSDYNPILLHSRFRQKDREGKVSELLNKNKWVCVSTQVVEAGVDVSADVLITDACPASSLIQRSGRVARYTDEYGEMYIVKDVEAKPYSEDLVNQTCSFLSNRKNGEYVDINWKLPDTENGYSKLLNYVHRGRIRVGHDVDFWELIISPWSSREALKMMRAVGSFTRDSVIMPCYVGAKSRENAIPLTSKIAFNLIRSKKARIMVDDKILEISVKNGNHLEELLLEGRFEWISVDTSAYRKEVGIVE
jgi:CRISPR-associated endonuclease/helicase Cas3